MPGSGTIGGGTSAEFDFKIKQKKTDPGDKQHWKGTDPDAVSGGAQPGTITVTFTQVPTGVGTEGKIFRVNLLDGTCVTIEWDNPRP